MKAVLEFSYPEDEQKLEHALKGAAYYEALSTIDSILRTWGELDAHSKIKRVVAQVLGEAP